jgi:hypothetical protein
MDLLGQMLILWEQQEDTLAGAGTQTAGLGFGGNGGTNISKF